MWDGTGNGKHGNAGMETRTGMLLKIELYHKWGCLHGLYEASDLLLGDHNEKSDTVKWIDA